MKNESQVISYHFFYNTPEHYKYTIEISSNEWKILEPKHIECAKWAKLDFHRCEHCPLSQSEAECEAEDERICPLAYQISSLVDSFPKIDPDHKTVVRVETGVRIYEKHTSVEQGLRSLLGLIFASSNCPHLHFFKPMARFHLPFATEEESLFRVFATFALYNVLSKDSGLVYDLRDLKKIYQNLQVINTAMCDRIKSVTEKNSTLSAVLLLDILSKSMLYSIEQSFDEFQQYFSTANSSFTVDLS